MTWGGLYAIAALARRDNGEGAVAFFTHVMLITGGKLEEREWKELRTVGWVWRPTGIQA